MCFRDGMFYGFYDLHFFENVESQPIFKKTDNIN